MPMQDDHTCYLHMFHVSVNINSALKGAERGEAMKVPFSVDLTGKTAIVTGGSGVLCSAMAYVWL